MKKSISLLLALMLILSMSITAFAENNLGAGVHEGEVTGTYVAGNEGSGTVFSVDITWENLAFTYKAANEPVWDTKDHKYSDYVAACWEGEGSIIVTNHSNTVISAVPKFVADEGFSDAKLRFDTEKLHLSSAEFMEFGENQTGTITVTAEGSLPAGTQGKIGVVQVTIAEDTDVSLADAEALYQKADALATEADLYQRDNFMNDPTPEQQAFVTDISKLSSDTTGLQYAISACEEAPADAEKQAALNKWYKDTRESYFDVLSQYNAFKAAD